MQDYQKKMKTEIEELNSRDWSQYAKQQEFLHKLIKERIKEWSFCTHLLNSRHVRVVGVKGRTLQVYAVEMISDNFKQHLPRLRDILKAKDKDADIELVVKL